VTYKKSTEISRISLDRNATPAIVYVIMTLHTRDNSLSYIFGRVISSEINRSIARAERNQIKANELKREIAAGREAYESFIKWAELNPDHPLVRQMNSEAEKIDGDLRLTEVTRLTRSSTLMQNGWRLAQQESQAGKAKMPVLPRKRKHPLLRIAISLMVGGFIFSTCSHEDEAKQVEPSPTAVAVSTPAPVAVSTPAPTPELLTSDSFQEAEATQPRLSIRTFTDVIITNITDFACES
jgi:hypothetical protein